MDNCKTAPESVANAQPNHDVEGPRACYCHNTKVGKAETDQSMDAEFQGIEWSHSLADTLILFDETGYRVNKISFTYVFGCVPNKVCLPSTNKVNGYELEQRYQYVGQLAGQKEVNTSQS